MVRPRLQTCSLSRPYAIRRGARTHLFLRSASGCLRPARTPTDLHATELHMLAIDDAGILAAARDIRAWGVFCGDSTWCYGGAQYEELMRRADPRIATALHLTRGERTRSRSGYRLEKPNPT